MKTKWTIAMTVGGAMLVGPAMANIASTDFVTQRLGAGIDTTTTVTAEVARLDLAISQLDGGITGDLADLEGRVDDLETNKSNIAPGAAVGQIAVVGTGGHLAGSGMTPQQMMVHVQDGVEGLINEMVGTEVDAAIGVVAGRVDGLETTVGTLATTATVSGINTRVGIAEGDIEALQTAVGTMTQAGIDTALDGKSNIAPGTAVGQIAVVGTGGHLAGSGMTPQAMMQHVQEGVEGLIDEMVGEAVAGEIAGINTRLNNATTGLAAAHTAAGAAQATANAAIPRPGDECDNAAAGCALTFRNGDFVWEVIGR